MNKIATYSYVRGRRMIVVIKRFIVGLLIIGSIFVAAIAFADITTIDPTDPPSPPESGPIRIPEPETLVLKQ